jgi:hypothetical protein
VGRISRDAGAASPGRSKIMNSPIKGHMVRLGEMTYIRLHCLRLKIMRHMQEAPHLYPDRSHTVLSISDLIDLLLQQLPQEYTNG